MRKRSTVIHIGFLVCVAAAASGSAQQRYDSLWGGASSCFGAAETGYSGTIASEGVAVVETAPDYVEFQLIRRITSTSLAQAAQLALEFEPRLRELLKARELSPSMIENSGPILAPGARPNEAGLRIRLRFSVTDFVKSEEDFTGYATLCEKVFGLAQPLHCVVEGPTLGLSDPEPSVRAAIGKAVENAYPAAEAVARIMPGYVIAVQHVDVQEVIWGQNGEMWEARPSLHRLTCTAKVRVIYVFSSGL